jgi:hypothetical protein
MPLAVNRPQKITFAEMRSSGVRDVLGLSVLALRRDDC